MSATDRTHTVLELRDERDTLKMLRETLSIAKEMCVEHSCCWRAEDMPHVERIDRLIAEIDSQRPLGPGGKHGDRHTPSCGCER